ncbi:MAG: type II secretion system F family protein [Verrucomicrobiales bacterium]|nr:type II secretion system F family protein [Verrucomicrobiae bacterium]
MALFSYQALKSDGSTATGEVDAPDRTTAFRKLDRQGLQPLALNLKGDGTPAKPVKASKNGTSSDNGKAAAKAAKSERVRKANQREADSAEPKEGTKKEKGDAMANGPVRLKRGQIVMFTEELSDLLGAGVQLEPALKIMESRDELSNLKIVTQMLRQQVRDGTSFSQALRNASPSFGELYTNMAAAGEISGALPTILRRQAQYLVTVAELQSKVAFALIYPAFLIFSGLAVCVLFVAFLIPQLADMMKQMGKELPLPAVIMQGVGDFVGAYWWLVIIVLAFAVWAFQKITTTPPYNQKWDRIKLSLPMAGPVFQQRFFVQFLETLSNLIGNGLPLLRALELTRDATVNLHLKDLLSEAIEYVREGASLSRTLKRVGFFPPLLTDMIIVGEQTGDLPLALERAASRYDKELQKKIDKVMALIQPLIIVIMAVIVGSMAYMMISVILGSIAGMK